ncbi:MAG TPA: PAS domain-containing protein [Steroidobacteraceae bacterium]
MAYNPPTSGFEPLPREGLHTDVAIRNTAQNARESEKHFRLIVDSIPGLVFTTRVAGEIEFFNRRLREYFGKSLQELQAWQTNDTIHADDLNYALDEWRHGIASRQPFATEYRLRRADGIYRWFQVRVVPGRDENGNLSGRGRRRGWLTPTPNALRTSFTPVPLARP